MPKQTSVRNVIRGAELREKISMGVEKAFDVAYSSYGANSGNIMIEHRYGEPLVSHDGITNIGRLVVSDPVENMAISLVRQASEKTNRSAGDSTTLTIVMTYLVYNYFKEMAKDKPRAVQKQIEQNKKAIIKAIKDTKIKATDELLYSVAHTSSGDDAIGHLVFDAINDAGANGAVTVVETPENKIESKIVQGFTFKKGMSSIAFADDMQSIQTKYDNPTIIVMSRIISKNDDIVPIIDAVLKAGAESIVLVADVSGQALETLATNKMNGKLNIVVVEPSSQARELFLRDVAAYAGSEVFVSPRVSDFTDANIGKVERAHITTTKTILSGPGNREKLDQYIDGIKDDYRRDALNGKTVEISVGAATQVERQELKLRIEDAVAATQIAKDYGVLPGGGTFLRDIYESDTTNMPSYLTQPYTMLVGSMAKETTEDKPYTPKAGYDIYSETYHTDVLEAGIVDSAKSIEEAIINSHSVAAQLLSINVALPFEKDQE